MRARSPGWCWKDDGCRHEARLFYWRTHVGAEVDMLIGTPVLIVAQVPEEHRLGEVSIVPYRDFLGRLGEWL